MRITLKAQGQLNGGAFRLFERAILETQQVVRVDLIAELTEFLIAEFSNEQLRMNTLYTSRLNSMGQPAETQCE